MGSFGMHPILSACIIISAFLLGRRGLNPVSFSISVIGVDRNSPMIRRSAKFWTLSRACWLVFVVTDRAVEPCSR